MRNLSERIEEKLGMLPLRERELWAHYTDEVKVLERRLAESGALCVKLALQKGGQVDEMRELKARLRAASDELKRLCPLDIEKYEGRCPKQDSNPCEYYLVWVALRGEAEG